MTTDADDPVEHEVGPRQGVRTVGRHRPPGAGESGEPPGAAVAVVDAHGELVAFLRHNRIWANLVSDTECDLKAGNQTASTDHTNIKIHVLIVRP